LQDEQDLLVSVNNLVNLINLVKIMVQIFVGKTIVYSIRFVNER